MSDNKRLAIILSAVILAFVFSYFEQIKTFSLQFFALSLLGFFVYKKSVQNKIITIVPQKNTAEISFITFSILLLIANTGNVESIFFPLAYLHIFLLSMSTTARNSIVVSFAILLFHLGFGIEKFTPREFSALAILPVLLLIFIFAKKEYDKAEKESLIIENLLQEQLKQEDD